LLSLPLALPLPHVAVSRGAITVSGEPRDVLEGHLENVVGLRIAAGNYSRCIHLGPFFRGPVHAAPPRCGREIVKLLFAVFMFALSDGLRSVRDFVKVFHAAAAREAAA
jgi:hypothetical protein